MKTLVILGLGIFALSLTACKASEITPDADTPSKAQAVGLYAIKQQVKRYDCNNAIVSNKVEVIKAPAMTMQIKPQTGSKLNLTDSAFKNLETGSQPAIYGFTKFTIDHSPGYLNMRVVDGVNEIKYDFWLTDGHHETGSRFINVTYGETLKPGFIEYHPSVQDCAAPTPTPAPTP